MFIVCFIGKYILPVLVAAALMFVVINGIRFINDSASEERRRESGMGLLWSVVALAILLSAWVIPKYVAGTFGVDAVIPQFPTQ